MVGGERPEIEIHSIGGRKLLTQFKAHERRSKAGAVVKLKEKLHLITASNDGLVKLWQIQVKSLK